MQITFGEYFGGAGGMALGAASAMVDDRESRWNLVPTWAFDSDPDACETYRRNIHDGRDGAGVVCGDVRAIDPATLRKVDVFLFGFPCNDFSVVGEVRGLQGRYGPLYLEAVKALRTLQPLAFVAENVPGILAAHGGRALGQVMGDLRRAGYRVVAHKFRAEEYGVPQARHRVLLVGFRNDLAMVFRPPAPCGPILSSRDAIEWPALREDAANHEKVAVAEKIRRRLALIRPGENVWQAQDRLGRDVFGDVFINGTGARLSTIYKRLDPNRPSYTVTGSGGGGTLGYHWAEPRPLTNREKARLQTFPDEFVFVGGHVAVRRQVGNAVPPALARVILEAVLKSLAGVEYESVDPNLILEEQPIRRGRPRRLEAADGPRRATSYRRRRAVEARLVAGVLARKLGETSILDRDVSRFIGRHLGAAFPEHPGISVTRRHGETRSQAHRRGRCAEERAVAALLDHLALGGALDLAGAEAEAVTRFRRRLADALAMHTDLPQTRPGQSGALGSDQARL